MSVIEITKDNFESDIMNSSLPAVLDFWGSKCTHCAALMPKYHELSDNPMYEGKIKFCSVNTSTNRRVAIMVRPAVMSLPAFLFFKNGHEVTKLIGNNISIDAITAKTKELL